MSHQSVFPQYSKFFLNLFVFVQTDLSDKYCIKIIIPGAAVSQLLWFFREVMADEVLMLPY
jgi:hypothetical protein